MHTKLLQWSTCCTVMCLLVQNCPSQRALYHCRELDWTSWKKPSMTFCCGTQDWYTQHSFLFCHLRYTKHLLVKALHFKLMEMFLQHTLPRKIFPDSTCLFSKVHDGLLKKRLNKWEVEWINFLKRIRNIFTLSWEITAMVKLLSRMVCAMLLPFSWSDHSQWLYQKCLTAFHAETNKSCIHSLFCPLCTVLKM